MERKEKEKMDNYIIRIYDQDLCSEWERNGCLSIAGKYISKIELIEDLKNNGLKIIRFGFSNLGACYFFEVQGEYNGDIKYQKLDIKPECFDWGCL